MADLHLVFTDYEHFGYSVTSPQIPGLVAAYETMEEAYAKVEQFSDLVDHDAVWLHEQKYTTAPNGDEYLVRFLGLSDDPLQEQRETCVGRALAAVENGRSSDSAAKQPQLKTGERLIIAVVGTDILGWCLDQMDDGAGVTLEMNPYSDVVYSVQLFDKDTKPGAKSLEDLGLSRDSSIDELFDSIMAAEVSDIKIAVHG